MPLSNLAVRDVETVIHPYTQLAAFRDTGPDAKERSGIEAQFEAQPAIQCRVGIAYVQRPKCPVL